MIFLSKWVIIGSMLIFQGVFSGAFAVKLQEFQGFYFYVFPRSKNHHRPKGGRPNFQTCASCLINCWVSNESTATHPNHQQPVLKASSASQKISNHQERKKKKHQTNHPNQPPTHRPKKELNKKIQASCVLFQLLLRLGLFLLRYWRCWNLKRIFPKWLVKNGDLLSQNQNTITNKTNKSFKIQLTLMLDHERKGCLNWFHYFSIILPMKFS